MIAYKFRSSDQVFDGVVELPDGPTIPQYHTRTPAPEKAGYYAVMQGGWKLIEGPTPPEPVSLAPLLEQAKKVRTQRDAKLTECDWRVIKALENGEPQDFAWAEYRQGLRDITKQDGFPWDITWPVEP